MIDFRSLEIFMWVAELRNYRRAAERLNIAPPAVGQRIRALERFLNVRLVKLERRRVALTPEGHEFLVHAQRLLGLYREMIEKIGDRSTTRGIVRLGVSESIVHTWLPSLFARVNATYPHLGFEIDVNISPSLRDRLVAKDLDLAFLLGPIDNQNVHSRPLCSFPVAFVAGDKIGLPREPIALEHIVKWPLITFARNTQPYMALQQLLTREQLRATIHASASLEAVVRMALDGVGIAVIPPAIIQRRVDACERLRCLNTTIKLPDLNFVVGWPDGSVHHAARKVAEIATEVAREMPKSEAA
jgi:DNA-binding transcriptional LysR family regulator